jgi:hypothetical protein
VKPVDHKLPDADRSRLEEDLRACERLIAARSGGVEPYETKAGLLNALARPREALDTLGHALRLNPGNPRLYWNASLCYLQMGDYRRGWQLYGSRHGFKSTKTANGQDRASRVRPERLWVGQQSLEGKTLFVQSEQGFGDLIQFCRYVPLLERRGARVILSVPPNMLRVLRSLSPTTLLTSEEDPVPAADYHCMLLGLPAACDTTLDTIPATVPYLRAELNRVDFWARRLKTEGLKVGICWQGRVGAADVGRSCPPAAFAALAAVPGVRLYSLQKGLVAGQFAQDLGADFDAGGDAFVDTAAVMHSLDLVITIDTAVAHLAGALGVRTWVALKFSPDWRWLLDRRDSPWYPSLRLFRQPSVGDWPAVFDAITRELREVKSAS